MNNVLADDITFAGKVAKYNDHCKRLLSNKQVLARILKETAEEFKDMQFDEIIECIEGTPVVSQIPVMYSGSNERVLGADTVDTVPNEGTVTFDIRFVVYVPESKERIKMIINVEGQNKFKPTYSLVTRGIFYGARMISSQYGVEFKKSEYHKIKKVYSIWVCMNAPDYVGNAISVYSFSKRDILGNLPDIKEAYDKIVVGVVCLNRKNANNNSLTGMLNTLFSKELEATEKIRKLKEEYQMIVEQEEEKEMKDMCNFGEGLVEEVIEEETQKSIQKSIAMMRKAGIDDEKIVKLIADEYVLSEDEIKQRVVSFL